MFGELLLSALLSLSGLHIWQFSGVPPEPTEVALKSTIAEVETLQYTQTIAPGASRVQLLTVTITPSCRNNVSFFSVDIKKTGFGANEDIEALYITQNNLRKSAVKQLNSNNIATLSLREVEFEPCVPTTIAINADFSAEMIPTSEHRFIVEAIEASENVEIQTQSTSVAASAPNQQIGTVSVVNLPVNGPIRYGSNRIVGRARLTNNDSKDQLLRSITFTNMGSAQNSEITQLQGRVKQSGEYVTEVTNQLTNDKALLQFTKDYVLQANSSIELQLIGTVNVGSSETIQFTINEPSDLVSTTINKR